jgi:CBS domain-containing protein
MARQNISLLGDVDDEGRIVGIITATDLLKLPTCPPFDLHQEIQEAQSIEQLGALGLRILNQVRFALGANTEIQNIVQLISGFNDAITLRLIAPMETSKGIRLTAGAAYHVLGGEGRGEQTLRTDQDNATAYVDDLTPGKLREVKRLADRRVEALEEIGVPRCPGNIIASSPHWPQILPDWNQLVLQWITVPTPKHVLNFGMFQDLRPLLGAGTLGLQLRDQTRATLQRNAYFSANMADHVARSPSPFTMFGRIRVEQRGEHWGKIDLKKSVLFAITAEASLLALKPASSAGTAGNNSESEESFPAEILTPLKQLSAT